MKKTLLLLSTALLLGACGSSASEEKVTTKEVDKVEQTSTEENKTEEKTESEVGKRSNPVPVGQSATWDVIYGDSNDEPVDGTVTTTISNIVRGDEAYQQLVSENEYNEEAPEGYEWLVFNLKLTLDEGSEDDAFNTSQISIVPIASDGSEVDQTIYPTFSDGTDFGFKDVYKGGSDDGKVGLIVPIEDETLIELTDWNNSVFFKVQ